MEDEDESRVLRGPATQGLERRGAFCPGVQVVGESRQRLVWAGAGVQEGDPGVTGDQKSGRPWLAGRTCCADCGDPPQTPLLLQHKYSSQRGRFWRRWWWGEEWPNGLAGV